MPLFGDSNYIRLAPIQPITLSMAPTDTRKGIRQQFYWAHLVNGLYLVNISLFSEVITSELLVYLERSYSKIKNLHTGSLMFVNISIHEC